ncbi:MAG: hypothetical protein J7K31_01885 [Candidatus Aenigmarchaeota archaeon]|nr:hypothetical protein [Candidatus Aenigmarchaeota archaeon]
MSIHDSLKTARGVYRTFIWLVREEWHETDHKLLKIVSGIISFAISVAFWYFLFRGF